MSSTTESSRYNDNKDYPITHDTCDKVNAGELETLIQMLQHKIKTKDSHIKCIKYPNLLMTSLMELNYLVGMDRLKDSIALQVMRLIDGLNNGEQSSKMLNTILYGPPGVGKTKVGIILAKIWCALGHLQKPTTVQAGNTQTQPGVTGVNTGIVENNQASPWITIMLLFLVYI